ncbi:lasso peptide biosynthesis B2 protein [Novosphingobium sp. TH158]|uniref:lasso peptide biosynthesis B2 protein n=1 Tax=Novosphingobium sp. TH158 TaxID=2067455 RepID=UPI0013044088|nr:lasso peptide biosynthesis B2 protein [Novosphingobium sp. TH158]
MIAKIVRHRRDLPLLLEAAAELTAATIAIRCMPFRVILRSAGRAAQQPPSGKAARLAICDRIKWAIGACAPRLPWRPLCFPQGLAAQRMLRRRGVPSVFYYGARIEDEGMSAHVWVCDGERVIVGGKVPADMRVLLRVPPASAEGGCA